MPDCSGILSWLGVDVEFLGSGWDIGRDCEGIISGAVPSALDLRLVPGKEVPAVFVEL